ncbi:MAG TPA: carboxypeptidase-like regulatory domain-containing protein [Opitutaceae bacterium]|jgi:hypothetical protein
MAYIAGGPIQQPSSASTKTQAASLQSHLDLLFLTPISLYGKVIDEAGYPIAEANINISFDNSIITNSTPPSENIKSDSNGVFHAAGHGLGIIVKVSKGGYYSDRSSRGSFIYAKEAGNLNGHTDPSAPAIFRLRKIGPADSAIKNVKRAVHVKEDGTPACVDISSGAISMGTAHGIEVREWIGPTNLGGGRYQKYDWHANISVPNGGIQLRTGKYDFEAPADGYRPSVEIVMNKNDRAWNDHVTNDYFISFSDGSYARFDLTLTASGRGFNYIGFFNPASRNLEFGTPRPGYNP